MSAPMVAVREPVLLPAEFSTPGVRSGCTLIRGALPAVGERALLTARSCYSLFAPVSVWLFVERVEAAYLPANRWLIGVDLRTDRRCRKLVDLSRLIIERAPTPVRWAS